MPQKLTRPNLSEDAYTFLRDLFVNGTRYNPGDKISVEELSRELGVSRTPLWSAINRLEAEGIVEIAPRLGVYLIEYDPDRVLDIYLAREALEGMAARIAAENATERQLALLKSNLTQQKQPRLPSHQPARCSTGIMLRQHRQDRRRALWDHP